jgi:hypothetical protein
MYQQEQHGYKFFKLNFPNKRSTQMPEVTQKEFVAVA